MATKTNNEDFITPVLDELLKKIQTAYEIDEYAALVTLGAVLTSYMPEEDQDIFYEDIATEIENYPEEYSE